MPQPEPLSERETKLIRDALQAYKMALAEQLRVGPPGFTTLAVLARMIEASDDEGHLGPA